LYLIDLMIVLFRFVLA